MTTKTLAAVLTDMADELENEYDTTPDDAKDQFEAIWQTLIVAADTENESLQKALDVVVGAFQIGQ
jgi:hypothetical protein